MMRPITSAPISRAKLLSFTRFDRNKSLSSLPKVVAIEMNRYWGERKVKEQMTEKLIANSDVGKHQSIRPVCVCVCVCVCARARVCMPMCMAVYNEGAKSLCKRKSIPIEIFLSHETESNLQKESWFGIFDSRLHEKSFRSRLYRFCILAVLLYMHTRIYAHAS